MQKEKARYALRSTEVSAQVTNCELKFAAMNLKNLAAWKCRMEKILLREEVEKDFLRSDYFSWLLFSLFKRKACLGVIAKTDFFYRLRRHSAGCRLFSNI